MVQKYSAKLLTHYKALLYRVAPSAPVLPIFIPYSLSETQVLLVDPMRVLRCARGPGGQCVEEIFVSL